MNNRLKLLRTEQGWSQAELGERLGLSRQAVNAIEAGKYDPSLALARKIARLFHRSIEDVFDDEHATSDDGNREENIKRSVIAAVLNVLIVITAAMLPVAMKYASGGKNFFDAENPASPTFSPEWSRISIGSVFLLIVCTIHRMHWLYTDEMRQKINIMYAAAIGYGFLIMFIVLNIIGPFLSPDQRTDAMFFGAIAFGLVTITSLWRRYGYLM